MSDKVKITIKVKMLWALCLLLPILFVSALAVISLVAAQVQVPATLARDPVAGPLLVVTTMLILTLLVVIVGYIADGTRLGMEER